MTTAVDNITKKQMVETTANTILKCLKRKSLIQKRSFGREKKSADNKWRLSRPSMLRSKQTWQVRWSRKPNLHQITARPIFTLQKLNKITKLRKRLNNCLIRKKAQEKKVVVRKLISILTSR